MDFFKAVQRANIEIKDAANQRISPQISVCAKKGIWRRNNEWTCFKRNQFQLCVQIKNQSCPLYIHNSRVMHYKIEVSCLGILDSKKVKVLQKTENGLDKVHPLYIPVMPSSTTTIGKLQFSRSTPSNKARNLSDPYFQVVVRVSAVTLTRSEFEIVSYTSENLSVLSGTPAQYSLDREPKYKYLPNQSYVNRFRSFSPRFNISSVQVDGKLPEINNLHLFNEQQFTCPIGKQYFGDSSSSDGENTVRLEPMGVDLALAPATTNNPCYFQDPVDHLLYNFFNGF